MINPYGMTILAAILFIYLLPFTTVWAQCPTGNQATGLISSGGSISNFGNQLGAGGSGVCATGDNAAFVSYKIPNYATLKSIYYDQAKSENKAENGSTGESQIKSLIDSGKNLIYISGDLGINSNGLTGNKTAVIFVNGSLSLLSPLTQLNYGDSQSGIVFIVKGDVNIGSSVTLINAVIITEGEICTAFISSSGCPDAYVPSPQLVINGSLISLNPEKKIKFKRTLVDNSQAAEVINHQPKYLVILRDILSSPLQKWSEIQ